MARELYYRSGERERDYRPDPRGATGIGPFASPTVRFYLASLVVIALLVPLQRSWVVEAILALLLLTVPGILLLRALRIPGRVIADFPALVPCASIGLLLFTGLTLDLVGPSAGMAAPLRTVPILCAVEAVCIGLLIISKDAGPKVDIQWKMPSRPALMVIPFTLPLVAAAGALRLNNGHSNSIAIAALVLCIAVLVVSMLYASRLDESVLIVTLFAVSLALMLSFSLRGTLVYGWDIATEYNRFSETTAAGVWHLTHRDDAYGAMLSLTVMPTEVHFITGISDLMVFKLVYPLFGALFSIEIFALARRILSSAWAYAASAITIVQAGFAQELPALARQEVALALFGALVAVMLYRPPKRTAQWILLTLLTLSMVVSHYSTTYVAITMFGAAVVIQWLVSWFRDTPRVTGTVLLCFAVSLVGALIWYGPVTKSQSGFTAFAQTLATQGLDVMPTQSPGESPIAAFLGTGQQSMSASEYQQQVHQEYVLDNSPITPFSDAGLAVYNLRDSAAPEPPVRLKSLHSAVGLITLLSQQALNILGAIGAILLVFRRKNSFIGRAIGFLSLGATIFLVLVKLSGTLATFYNSERALLQALGVFSITFCWLLQGFDRSRGRRIGSVLIITAATLTIFVVDTSSLLGAVLGGSVQSNVANSGEDYERFVRTPQELASASWLGSQVNADQLVYADVYAQLPLVAMTGLGPSVIQDITPLTIDQNAWVYASTANVVDGRSRVDFQNYGVTYVFPAQFLDENFNVVYSDGASEVFHG